MEVATQSIILRKRRRRVLKVFRTKSTPTGATSITSGDEEETDSTEPRCHELEYERT